MLTVVVTEMRRRTDDARNPACAFALSAIRRQDVEVHHGAESAGVDILLAHAGEDQLIAIRAADVEAHLPIAGRQEPSVDQGSLVARRGECVDEIRPNLVAARTNRGSNRNDEIRGPAAEFPTHGIDRSDDDACGST